MTLRKIAALGLAASTLALVGTSVAGAVGGGDVNGPKCADILGGAVGYGADTLGAALELAAPSCQGVTYSVVALDQAGGPVIGSASITGDGSDQAILRTAIIDDDDSICVYVASTAGRGPHVFDRGPDADAANDCVTITEGGGAPGFQDFS